MNPNPWKAVGLVANREISTRLRNKAFIVTTLATVVILAALAILVSLLGGKDKPFTVGVTSSTSALATPLEASAKSLDIKVDTRTVDESAGRDQVAAGKLSALLVGDGSSVHVVVHKSLDQKLGNALHVLAGNLALQQQVTSLGGDPATVRSAIASASVTTDVITPPHKYNAENLVIGIIAGILIYMSLMLNGQAVAQGVVEEKSSRVVELLLAAVRPWQLMAGKVAGIGVVGLIQMVVVGGVGVAVGLATGALSISASAAAGTVIWLVVWFLLGFLMYALAFAAVAALVSRQEDVNGVVAPVLMFVIVGYVLGVSILPSDPGNGTLAVMSMIPTFAPTLMPMRLAMGGVPAWQALIAVVGTAAMIPLLVWASGRIYRNAVMRSGARIKLRDAWSPV
jgi:ABC-2 type transport system permease protein